RPFATGVPTLSPHDALPICPRRAFQNSSELPMMGILVKISRSRSNSFKEAVKAGPYSKFYPHIAKSQTTKQAPLLRLDRTQMTADRKSTRLNSSHVKSSHAG